MKRIFVGTIKKCKNLYQYKEYGEERYIGAFATGHIEFGSIYRSVDVIAENAILIKLNSKKYLWFGLLNKEDDNINIDFNIPIKIINTIPSKDNDLFIDEKTLEFYSDIKDSKLNNRKTKLLKKAINYKN